MKIKNNHEVEKVKKEAFLPSFFDGEPLVRFDFAVNFFCMEVL
jgi:hypothetical protein